MNILGHLNSLNGVLQGATGLVRELKQPRLSSEDFASILKKQLEQAPAQRLNAMEQVAVAKSERFVERMDFDGDQKLSLEESGLKAELFQKLDANQDGYLTAEELRNPAMEWLNKQALNLESDAE